MSHRVPVGDILLLYKEDLSCWVCLTEYLWEIYCCYVKRICHVGYVSQSTSGRYIVFHVAPTSLSYTHVLYTIRLDFELKLIIYVCLSVSLSVRLSVFSFSNGN